MENIIDRREPATDAMSQAQVTTEATAPAAESPHFLIVEMDIISSVGGFREIQDRLNALHTRGYRAVTELTRFGQAPCLLMERVTA